MPGSLRARLDRLSNALQAETVADQAASSDDQRMMSVMAKIQLQLCPVLRHVEQVDTDFGTYAKIQEMLAKARGQWGLADHWHEQMLAHRAGDPAYPSVMNTDAVFARIRQLTELRERGEKTDLEKAAENAERRLGSKFVRGLSRSNPYSRTAVVSRPALPVGAGA